MKPESNMSFVGTLNFFDNKDKIYSISVICTADSSITNIFSWLRCATSVLINHVSL